MTGGVDIVVCARCNSRQFVFLRRGVIIGGQSLPADFIHFVAQGGIDGLVLYRVGAGSGQGAVYCCFVGPLFNAVQLGFVRSGQQARFFGGSIGVRGVVVCSPNRSAVGTPAENLPRRSSCGDVLVSTGSGMGIVVGSACNAGELVFFLGGVVVG